MTTHGVGTRIGDRIVVVGCGGSGKTFTANRIADARRLPVTHLDAIYYDRAWNPLPHSEFVDMQQKLVSADRWVIDGNYSSTLPIRLAVADTLIWLDLPSVTCLSGIVKRRLRYGGGQHDDGVYDRITGAFVRYIVTYRTRMLPRIQALVEQHPHLTVIRLTSRRHVSRFLAEQSDQADVWGDPEIPGSN